MKKRIIDAPKGSSPEIVEAIGRLPPDAIIRFYHGTSPKAAGNIMKMKRLLPDDLGAVGLSASCHVARSYAYYKSGHMGEVVEILVRKSEMGEPDTKVYSSAYVASKKQISGKEPFRIFETEIGGTGRDSILVKDLFKRGKWSLPIEGARIVSRKECRSK